MNESADTQYLKSSKQSFSSVTVIPEGMPPCRLSCPAGVNIPRYLRLISQSRYTDALSVIMENTPFPSVCGRVCFAPCEVACRLNDLDESVPIRALKRFISDRASIPAAASTKSTGKKIAIIGSGPSGLTAAYYLADLGHYVTVFERMPEPGGMMRWGIPEFRLPKRALARDINRIEATGVEICTNSPITSLEQIWQQGYLAAFIATGAHKSRKIGIPGEDDPQIIDCLHLLKEVNSGRKVKIGSRVAIVGGGNSAVDAARVAVRMGCPEVTILYRRTETDMPAYRGEVEKALHEGVRLQVLSVPIRASRSNGALILECMQMKPGRLDDSGRSTPEPITGSEFSMNVDAIVSAIGQVPISDEMYGLTARKDGTIQVDPESLSTGIAGVFAGGDVVSGPATVIEAIAMGKKAANSIDIYLGGHGITNESPVLVDELTPVKPLRPVGRRALEPLLPIPERTSCFEEVEVVFTEAVAIEQAKRCLQCDLAVIADATKCAGCLTCSLRCSFRFDNAFNLSKARIEVNRLVCAENEFAITFHRDCDACGICVKYCPYGALQRDNVRGR